jgi:hypothetical protein
MLIDLRGHQCTEHTRYYWALDNSELSLIADPSSSKSPLWWRPKISLSKSLSCGKRTKVINTSEMVTQVIPATKIARGNVAKVLM